MANESYVQVDLFGNPVMPEVKKEEKKEAGKASKKAAVKAKKTDAKKTAVSTCKGDIADYNAKTPVTLPARIVGISEKPIVITKGNLRVASIAETLKIAAKSEPGLGMIAGSSLVEIATAPDGGSILVFAVVGESIQKKKDPKKIFVTPHVYFDIDAAEVTSPVTEEAPVAEEAFTDTVDETEEEDSEEEETKPVVKAAAATLTKDKLTDKERENYRRLCEDRGVSGEYDVVVTGDALLCISKTEAGESEELAIGGVKVGPKARARLKEEKISIRRYGDEYQFVMPYRSEGKEPVTGSYMESDELRIPLPVTLVTAGRTFSLTAEMLNTAKSYTTLDAVKEFLTDRYAVNRVGNLSAYYVEEEHRIVAVTQLHSKG